MSRARLLAPALLAVGLAGLIVPGPGRAAADGPGAPAVDIGIELEAPAWAGWTERLEQAVARLEQARRRLRRAEQAWTLALHRDHPRGEARAELLAELEAARAELAAAEAEAPVLVEQARRAGVPAGILQRYEEALGLD